LQFYGAKQSTHPDKRLKTEPFCIGSGMTDTEYNGPHGRRSCSLTRWKSMKVTSLSLG